MRQVYGGKVRDPMSIVDEIKDRVDIVEVASESGVELMKSGSRYKGLCPFHEEETPSFVVFPKSGRWYCFGECNEGGDVFNLVMKIKGWDFRAALEALAERAGVELTCDEKDLTAARSLIEKKIARSRALLSRIDSLALLYALYGGDEIFGDDDEQDG